MTHQHLVDEWHPSKNGSLQPLDVTAKSTRKVWWTCVKNNEHEVQQDVFRRVAKGCPVCRMEQNSLGTLYPAVASEWHPSKNSCNLRTDRVAAYSKVHAWWLCSKDSRHEWTAVIGNRTARMSGCPYCAGRKAGTTNSLEKLRPDLAAEWHPRLNNDLMPEQVTCGSDRIVWWLCKRTGVHEWEAAVGKRVARKQGCPVCCRVTEKNNLQNCYPDIAAQWHPTKNRFLFPKWDPKTERLASQRIQKNRRLKPSDVAGHSKEFAWWQCDKSVNHVWYERIGHRTSRSAGCPFCSGFRIAVDNNLEAKEPAVAKMWHRSRNLPLTADKVTAGTAKVVWWKCFRSAKHIWQASVVRIVSAHRKGHTGCRFCSGHMVSEDDNLVTKAPHVAKLWHPTRNLPSTPNQFSPASPNIAWWQCEKNTDHVYDAEIHNVVRSQKFTSKGCPYCSGHRVAKENSLLARYPQVAVLWDKSANATLRAKRVTYMSNKSVHWRCDQNKSHRWEATVCYMVTCHQKGRVLCPICKAKSKLSRR
jgi:hypothetical protein